MTPLPVIPSAARALLLILLSLAPASVAAQGPAAPPQLAMAERYVEAFNTGDADSLARVIERIYAPSLLADFGGARAAAWDRIELFRTYGPVEIRYVDEEPEVPIVWTRGTISDGWIGHQFHLVEGGPPRVTRHVTWRARPGPYPQRSLPADEVADSLAVYLERLADAGLFDGSVTMSRRGEILLDASFGSDRRPDPSAVTAETRFHIASVTKLLTITALLQLAQSGQVELDAPISTWIPEYPPPWRDAVTVRHLLTHTSGIELDEDPAFLAKVRAARTADELLAAQIAHLADREPRFEPGSEYDYTSEGIDLLAVIIERVTGRTWTDVVRDQVLDPAGMTRTRFEIPESEDGWALGFTSLNPDLQSTTPGALRPATEVLTAVAKPSSGAWSTARDLHRFTRALLDHRLLTREWTDSLLTPKLVTGELPKYGIRSWVGLGAQGEDLWGTRTVGHGGVVPGYSAAIEYLPRTGWLLTVVSNTGEATGFLVFQRFLELTAHAARTPSASAPADTSLAPRLRAYFAPLARTGDFSGSVLVARGDSVLFRDAFGLADHELGVPNTPGTIYQIASLTKPLTAAAIAILAERGALSLDDPLARFLPEFPNAGRITIRQLLRHEAGLANPDYVAAFSERIDLAELVRRIGERPPQFEPGIRGSYSNAGYNVLARVVEVASGSSYETFLRREIFEPLGMHDTSGAAWSEIVPGRAEPYLPGPPPSHVVNAPRSDPGFAIGSGSLWSTVDDLYEWAKAVHRESLFDRDRLDYPHGWGRLREEGGEGLRQTGLATGYTSSLSIWFADSLHVAILGNVELAEWSRWPDDVAAIVRGERVEPPEPRPLVALPASEPSGLVGLDGTYATQEHTIEIDFRDGGLWLTLDGWPVPKYLAPTEEPDVFLLRSDFGRLRFLRRDDAPGAPARVLEWIFGPDSRTAYPRIDSVPEHDP